ncbi:alpha/beta fold hydrolase [Microvirga sp. 2YAF29]|uniref:alpha/beta fold hydrolase n=1 Tax=Microvirga sp. 2YAF29 TaxID=3233031 RepID=UPI003F9EB36F
MSGPMDALELHHQDQGAGSPALVFLHYFAGSARSWNHVVRSLAAGHRCGTVDLPGFGSTPPLPDFSVQAMAEAIAAFILSCDLGQYILIGHSMGGKLAMACAAQKPPGLAGLVLVAPSPPTPEPMEEYERDRLLTTHGDLASAERTLQSIARRPLSEEDKAICIDDNLRTSALAWHWWLASGSRENIAPEIAQITCPVLVLGGTLDPVIPPHVITTQVTSRMPAARYVQISGAGHLVPFEAPQELAGAIQAFAGQPSR